MDAGGRHGGGAGHGLHRWCGAWGGAWGALVGLVLPVRCAGCGTCGPVLCDQCAPSVRPPAPAPPPAGLDALIACFAYEGAVREIIARAKYRNERAAFAPLAAAMVVGLEQARSAGPRAGVDLDVVTYPPTTRSRRRRRGFDQARLLALGVGRRRGLPVVAALDRRSGPAQTGLPAAARRAGPRFRARMPVPARVLLVDDVCTTGATLQAAARSLRLAGARQVVGLVAARRDPPGRAPRPALPARPVDARPVA